MSFVIQKVPKTETKYLNKAARKSSLAGSVNPNGLCYKKSSSAWKRPLLQSSKAKTQPSKIKASAAGKYAETRVVLCVE
jgi:hypothetical protein